MRAIPIAATAALILAFSSASLAGQDPAPTAAPPWDPTTTDPSPVDPTSPPAITPLFVEVAGERINGYVYLADGPGPHATVVFAPDVPGYETNADLAQALRRAGYNAALFGYRGTGASSGSFEWEQAADDVAAVLDHLSGPAATELRVDPDRVHLVGDGFGSWAALAAAGGRSAIGCVATVGAWNPAVRARELATGGAAAEYFRDAIQAAASDNGPVRGSSGDALIGALTEDAATFDLMSVASGGAGKSVLLITSAQGENDPARQTMLVGAALAGARANGVERFILGDDDAFSSSRVRVARSLVTWFERECPAW